ncbi:MAG: efflux RND transporter periplasmic adaptor subunit [Bryobacteraceae bacterium]|nr:efflux RND transporter periplasmic adaptor subunit [Bryobacteraceae bacterium]
MKKIIIRVAIALAVLGGVGYGGYQLFNAMPQRQASIPTTKVRQGDVVVRSFTRGELRAVRSATLSAPNLFGTVQVTKMAALGAFAREKDLVVEFDDAEVISRLEEKQLELDQIDEQVKKSRADLSIRNNQDQVELLRARYSVRRADLEVKRNELLSAIDAKKNTLTLDESKRRLKQLESDIKSRQEQAQAELAVLMERRNKSVLELNRERARLNQVKLLSPMSGLVAIKQNRGSAMMFGMQLPDIREGDQIQPGIPVAEVLDLSELEVVAKVGELDRANLREGQDVVMRLDAIADKSFTGKIKSMSATASANMFSSDPAKKFDVLFSVDMRQLLTTLGAKPDYIERVIATAEANRKKAPIGPPPGAMAAMMARMGAGGGGGMGAGGMGGGMMGGGGGGGSMTSGAPGFSMGGPSTGGFAPAGGQDPSAGGGQRRAGGGGGMMGAFTRDLQPDQATKMRDAITKALGGKSIVELEGEERSKVMASLREEYQKITGKPMPSRSSSGPGGAPTEVAQGGRRNGGSGPGGPGGGMMGGFGANGFSAKDMENAKLPLPPEEDSQIDVLLRPGLLSDVEIIVEKIPNAINVPTQAVFEKDGKPVVYVKTERGFEPRNIQIFKRSESVMVLTGGVKPNDVIALADPFAKPTDKKKKSDGGGGAGMPMGQKGSR